MPPKSVKVFAPGTVANVSCGFDILGFAVHQPGDEVEAQLQGPPGVRIKKITGDQGLLPTDPFKNTASAVVIKLLEHLKSDAGIEITLHKNMPLGSGLGSSAASGVAALVAANELLGRPLTRRELLPFAMEGERIACGAAHADNVAPGLMGGFVLVRSYNPLDVIELPTPNKLFCTLIHPHIEVQTRDARNILRKQIPIASAIVQWGNLGGLVAGLYREDYDLIGRSLEDVIVEPARSLLIPGFDVAKAAALNTGALGCGISGSGPSIFALCDSQTKALETAEAMKTAFADLSIGVDVFVSPVNKNGARVVEEA